MKRRSFLATSAGAAAFACGYSLLPARALGANDRVRVAVIGIGGKGNHHLKLFGQLQNVEVVAMCDADQSRMAGKEKVAPGAKKFQDYRKVLEMPDVDAVVIATPNHWHCAMAIAACQAGKHAYVEKPVSHGIWEGRRMVEAQQKYKKVVQAGTQQVSCPAVIECGHDLRSGHYGKVLWIHCFKVNERQSVGLRDKPLTIPPEIDYNLWAGPAPMDPVFRNKFHYDWHWDFRWGNGELGNWGVHYTSDLVAMLGWNRMPDSVIAAGGRFLWDDAADVPNMLFSALEHDGVPLTTEIRNLPRERGGKVLPVHMGQREGNIIMCEKGLIKLARGGGKAYSPDGKEVIKNYKGDGGRTHLQNFIDAIRANDHSKLAAPIEGCHISSGICHLSNISYRIGQTASRDEIEARMSGHEDIRNTATAHLQQLDALQVDWSKLRLGPQLRFDSARETFTGEHADRANALLRQEMREEFAVPEKV